MISWFKDGRPLPSSGRHNSDHFILKGVTRDDRGMYQCIVRRTEGETGQAAAELQLGGKYLLIQKTISDQVFSLSLIFFFFLNSREDRNLIYWV